MAASVYDSVRAAGSGTTLESGSLTVGGNNTVLYVFVVGMSGTPTNCTSVKWGGSGGDALTKIGGNYYYDTDWPAGDVSLWRLIAPAGGSTTVYATFAGSQDYNFLIAVAVQDAHQTTPNNTVAFDQNFASEDPSVSCVSVSGDFCVDFTAIRDGGGNGGTVSPDGSQTGIEVFGSAEIDWDACGGSSYLIASGASTSFSWTRSDPSTCWVHFALAINAAPTGDNWENVVADSVGITDAIDYVKRFIDVQITDAVIASIIAETGAKIYIGDSVGMADSDARVIAYIRALADSLGLSDSADRIASILRQVADSTGVTDDAQRTMAVLRAIADSAGVTDYELRSKITARFISDALGVTDYALRAVGYSRSATDSVGLTDATLRNVAILRALADDVGATDVVARVIAYARSISDSEGVTDVASRKKVTARFLADNLGLSDAVIRAMGYVRELEETIGYKNLLGDPNDFKGASWSGATDKVTQNNAVAPDGTMTADTLADIIPLPTADLIQTIAIPLDTKTRFGYINVKKADIYGAWMAFTLYHLGGSQNYTFMVFNATTGAYNMYGDTEGYGVIPLVDGWYRLWMSLTNDGTNDNIVVDLNPAYNSDGLEIGSTVTGSIHLWMGGLVEDYHAITDQIDVMIRSASQSLEIADDAGVTDVMARKHDTLRVPSEAVGVSDAGARSMAIARSIASNLGISDALTLKQLLLIARSVYDTVGVTDGTDRTFNARRYLADDIDVADFYATYKAMVRAIDDALSVEDSVPRLLDAVRAIADDGSITDAVKVAVITNIYTRIISDTAGVSDEAIPRIAKVRTIAEDLGVTDYTTIFKEMVRAISENVDLQDYPFLTKNMARIVADIASVSDVAQRVAQSFRSVSEAVGTQDALDYSLLHLLSRAVSEAVGVSDAPARALQVAREIAEVLGVSDYIDIYKEISRSIGESVGVTDDLQRLMSFVRPVAESLGLSDEIYYLNLAFLTKNVKIAEQVGLIDENTARIFIISWMSIVLGMYRSIRVDSASPFIELSVSRITEDVEVADSSEVGVSVSAPYIKLEVLR